MPRSAKRPCTYPGCGVLTETGRCDKHRHVEKRELDERRGGSTARLYDYRWQKASKAFLKQHPLCQCLDCDEGRKRVTAAEVVDHEPPHRGNKVLFWDRTTWRAMAKACHDRKTAREDGRWGRVQKSGARSL